MGGKKKHGRSKSPPGTVAVRSTRSERKKQNETLVKDDGDERGKRKKSVLTGKNRKDYLLENKNAGNETEEEEDTEEEQSSEEESEEGSEEDTSEEEEEKEVEITEKNYGAENQIKQSRQIKQEERKKVKKIHLRKEQEEGEDESNKTPNFNSAKVLGLMASGKSYVQSNTKAIIVEDNRSRGSGSAGTFSRTRSRSEEGLSRQSWEHPDSPENRKINIPFDSIENEEEKELEERKKKLLAMLKRNPDAKQPQYVRMERDGKEIYLVGVNPREETPKEENNTKLPPIDESAPTEQEEKAIVLHKGNNKEWRDLLKNDKIPMGIKLKKQEVKNNVVSFGREHCRKASPWDYSLVGYFTGRVKFGDLDRIREKWGVKNRMYRHRSGWFVFGFNSEEDREVVLLHRDNIIDGTTLMLRIKPPLFDFDTAVMTTMPIWVQLPHLPPECYSADVLSAIGSVIGNPIGTDLATAEANMLGYARICVEIDISEKPPNWVEMEGPGGYKKRQEILYERMPRYCNVCRRIGHDKTGCNFATPTPERKDNEAEKETMGSGSGNTAGTSGGKGDKGKNNSDNPSQQNGKVRVRMEERGKKGDGENEKPRERAERIPGDNPIGEEKPRKQEEPPRRDQNRIRSLSRNPRGQMGGNGEQRWQYETVISSNSYGEDGFVKVVSRKKKKVWQERGRSRGGGTNQIGGRPQ